MASKTLHSLFSTHCHTHTRPAAFTFMQTLCSRKSKARERRHCFSCGYRWVVRPARPASPLYHSGNVTRRASSNDLAGPWESDVVVKARQEHLNSRGCGAAVKQSWYFLLAPEEFGRAVPCMGVASSAAEAKPTKQVFLTELAPAERKSPHEEVDSKHTERRQRCEGCGARYGGGGGRPSSLGHPSRARLHQHCRADTWLAPPSAAPLCPPSAGTVSRCCL